MTRRARLPAPRTLPRVLLLLLCLSTFGCDQASKHTASALLEPSSSAPSSTLPLIEGVIELRYAENRGIAFGLLHDLDHAALPWFLGFCALAGTAAVVTHWWRRRHSSLVEQASYAAITAGGAANGVDRLRDGSVVDFIHVTGWPIFNVADVALVAGAVLFVLANTSFGASDRNEPTPSQ